jgi:hypothetical protein
MKNGNMSAIEQQNAFLAAREQERNQARQRLALQILCTAMTQDEDSKAHLCRRLKRLIERERLKGAKDHWSYDLNRHIGLNKALESLKRSILPGGVRATRNNC